MASTYLDIQKATGLSLSTISRYFNGGSVRPRTRQAIEQAAQALNFRVNSVARSLRSRRSRTIGLLIPELDSVFHTTIMARAATALRQKGYGCIVCTADADKRTEAEALQFLLDKQVDGIISIPLDKTGAHLRAAEAWGVPVVLADRTATRFDCDSVTVDNAAAGAMAADTFLARGHRRIGMVGGPPGVYTMRGRKRGFTARLQAASLYDESLCVDAEFDIQGGYRAARRLLALQARPGALFCANYELTLGTIMALNEAGLWYPGDVSLIGFDNMMLAGVLKPALTMVAQPVEAIAREAAGLMLARLEGGATGPPRAVVLPVALIEGASVATVPGAAPGGG